MPLSWQNGVTLETARIAPTSLPAANASLYLDLDWTGQQPIDPADLTFSLWLTGPDGSRWAQRDVTPFAHPWPPLVAETAPWRNTDRIAMTIPAGVPPGEYDLWAGLLDSSGHPISLAGDNPAPQAWLGALQITAPETSLPLSGLPIQFPQRLSAPGVDFLGHSVSDAPHLPGDDLAVSLFWLPTASTSTERHAFLQLLDDQGKVVAGTEGPPIPWHPTTAWQTDIPLHSQHRLRLPADLTPGRYTLIAGLFDPATGERLRWGQQDNLRLGEIATEGREHSFAAVSPQHPLDLTLEGGHRLLGYDLIAGEGPGSPVNLVLYWAPAGATDLRYSTFVHLLDPDGVILAQSDGEPAAGQLPTTAWITGEIVADPHSLAIPPDASPGTYRLAVGLYHPATGQRLPFVDANGAVISDNVTLPSCLL